MGNPSIEAAIQKQRIDLATACQTTMGTARELARDLPRSQEVTAASREIHQMMDAFKLNPAGMMLAASKVFSKEGN